MPLTKRTVQRAQPTNRRNATQLRATVNHYVANGNAGHPACQAAIATLNARAWAAESARLDAALVKGNGKARLGSVFVSCALPAAIIAPAKKQK